MTTVLRSALVWKEARGLGPAWLIAAALLVAVGFVDTGLDTVLNVQQPRAGASQLTVLFYVGACALLGALSIGQEFTDRTLAGLLAQPATRASVLLHKLGVVAAMLLALGGLAWAYGLTPFAVARAWPDLSPTGLVLAIVLPVLGGVLLTPCLTLLTRSALAGCVFTIGLSLATMIGSRAALIARTTISSLKAQRSSSDPPPRATMSTSQSARASASAIVRAISSAAPAPCTGVG